MPAKRYRVFIWVGLLLALNWLSIALLGLDHPGTNFVVIGNCFGSLFAHATLASAWTAFGPAPLIWRVPLSLAWVMSLPVAIGINLGVVGLQEAVLLFGSCLLGQWVLLQFPLWTLALVLGLRLRHINEGKQEPATERVQFGIRHLLIVTAIAGVLLGIGRIVVTNVSIAGEEPVFFFLAVAAIVVTLPLLLAALMRRLVIPGISLALLLTGVATALELPLSELVGASGPEMKHFVAINVASSILILLVAGIVRMNGYYLCVQPAAAESD